MNEEKIAMCANDHVFNEGVCGYCGLDIRGMADFTFDEATHTYQLNGRKLTSTTTILGVMSKEALIAWAAKMTVEYLRANAPKVDGKYIVEPILLEASKSAHTQKKDNAAAHGKDAHSIVERYILGTIDLREGRVPLPMSAEDTAAIAKFIDWAEQNVDHFLFAERKAYDAQLWFAGTADFGYVGKDGKRYIGDFKTSGGIYSIDYWLQCAAYRHLMELEGDAPYDGMVIVRLGRDGQFEFRRTFEYQMFWRAFVACLQIYRTRARCDYLVERVV